MARDKKGKKEQGGDTGEVVDVKETIRESHDAAPTKRSTRKGKAEKHAQDESQWEVNNGTETQDKKSPEPNDFPMKGKNAKKAAKRLDDDDESQENGASEVQSQQSKGKDTKKKNKKKGSKYAADDEDEDEMLAEKMSKNCNIKKSPDFSDEEDNESLASHKKKDTKKGASKAKKTKDSVEDDVLDAPTKKAKPSSFQFLTIEGDDDSDNADSSQRAETPEPVAEPTPKVASKGGKKSKKERRKKDDDEDIDKILEELSLEMTGGKKKEEPKEKVQIPAEVSKLSEPKITADREKTPMEEPSKKSAAKGKKAAADENEEKKAADDEEKDVPEEEGEHTVKTAAQKKKEKKEKEKLKKLAQYEQSAKKQTNTESKTKQKSEAPAEKKEKKETSPIEKDAEEKDEPVEEVVTKKSKKDKKGEEEKKDKKKPGKKQVAAMKEALKKIQEEEERLRLEEEAKIKAEEEAERLRQEKLRLEQEKKEKKKLKEKEKRERLRAEGKLLTKTQKQNKARMEATLAALREQGVDVPKIGEKVERTPRMWDRKKKDKKKSDGEEPASKEETPEPASEIRDVSPEVEEKMEVEPVLVEEPADVDEVKEAWDDTSEEEDEDESESQEKNAESLKNKAESSDSDDSESEDSDSEDESSDEDGKKADSHEIILERISKRRIENENNRSTSKLRAPIVCVLGHVDTGKTKILDFIRKTNVQTAEAGGITQQIGATMVPPEALREQCKMAKIFDAPNLKVPGLLIIDTPGHESFANLRSRGSSLCDIAILVVDIMHGLEPQTIESINLLKKKKTPFIVALNKVDRLYEWRTNKNKDIHDVIKGQPRNAKLEFEDRAKAIMLEFANQSLNTQLYYDNPDPRSYISIVPTSALSGDGMGNLMALVVNLTQQMMTKRLSFSEELQATVLEVKAIPGLGTTVDVILVNGRLREGDTMVLPGYEGPVVTQIRSLLMPQPLKELRVKNPYEEFKEIEAAQGVKITGKDLDKAIAGLQLLVANNPDEIPILKSEVAVAFQEVLNVIKLAERGVYVQASTLGSLEALLDFLKNSKIPYSGIRIGPVVKRDVMKASIMLEHDTNFAVILAFDVKVERDAQELADSLGVKIFQADIIYHLFDKFTAYQEELKNKKRDALKNVAVFPCKLRILPQYIFNSRDPIVVGVMVEAGIVKEGTPLCVPSKEFLEIGTVTTIEVNHKPMETARKGQEVCIKIEPLGGEAPKMFGRHFEHTDLLMSKISRQSIDVCKEFFRDDLTKTDWQLMVELKKLFQIL